MTKRPEYVKCILAEPGEVTFTSLGLCGSRGFVCQPDEPSE